MSDDKDLGLIERAVGRMGARPNSPGRGTTDAEPVDMRPKPAERTTPAVSASETKVNAPEVELDLNRLKAEGYITPVGGRGQLAEEFRMIKRPLLINAFGKGAALVPDGNLIMVTSTYPGEGKTFTAVNLALSITKEVDKTVLLVDADVGRSRIHRVLGTPSGPGLIDLLLDDQIDLGDVIVRTNIPNLRVLPKGRSHPHATELLASNEMARVARELANRYPDRIVIFDSPPLLITSEAVVLSSHMGQIVFVVESKKTPQGAVKEALSLLDDSKPIGLVLNKTRKAIGTEYYGYGGYGAYHPAEGAAT